VPDGFFERLVRFGADNDILIVHDNAYSRDDLRRLRGAVVPGDAGGQGRRRRGLLALQGLQHDRLALRRDRRQRARRSLLLAAQDQHRLGLFEAVQLAGVAALSPQLDHFKAEMNRIYERRRDLVCDALAGSASR
jgi:aspartate/methionine/tyrosine aminotransferase